MHQKQIERLSDKQVARDRISNSDDNYYNKYLKQTGLSENNVYPRPIGEFINITPFIDFQSYSFRCCCVLCDGCCNCVALIVTQDNAIKSDSRSFSIELFSLKNLKSSKTFMCHFRIR